MIQERFDETIGLVRQNADTYPAVDDLLALYPQSIVMFSFFNKPAVGNTRQRILEEYQLRMSLGRRHNDALPLSPRLLDDLRDTPHQHICISTFTTGIGIFRIFSDFAREDLVGVLFSESRPGQASAYSYLFMNGQLLSKER